MMKTILPNPKKVLVSTRKFENSHGRKPRGTGAWAFAPAGTDGQDPFIVNASYSEAKAAAQARFAHQSEIEVLP